MTEEQVAPTLTSSYSNSTRTWMSDVFLSFRAEDTRRGFAGHLYHALVRRGFLVFRDDVELARGESISGELPQAIVNSAVSIVIISENYASSSWCLDELRRILDSRKELGQQVIPIFYDVDPSDVRHQRGTFAHAFVRHEEKFQKDKQNVQKWRDSLTEIAEFSGWDSQKYKTEAELVENVVEHLWDQRRAELSPVIVNDGLIGIEWRVDQMLSLLEIGSDDVRFIGIWGMGGVGKTTLARALFGRLHSQFDYHCFLANVRELSERKGLLYLQNQLLSHLKIKNFQILDTHHGMNTFGYLFSNRKVLLVLDDVNLKSQLQNLAGSREWFGDGSRIIITTRNVHLLTAHAVNEIYKVKPMKHDESYQLFFQKAFRGGRSVPDEEKFQQLALSAINSARGLPLALCVLGSFFYGRDGLTGWEDALKLLREDSDNDIFKTLRISYNELSYAEKQIFLDIACFFNMWGKDEITQILESCGFPARTGLRTLREKSLLAEIEIGNTTYIEMHELVQDMGRFIVIQESPVHVGRRTRLFLPDDIDQLLERNMGTEATEAVVLPHTFEKHKVHWHPEAFLKMCCLRLLIISCDLDLPLHLKGLPGTLKVLHWYGYPFEALPSKENMNQLRYIKLQNSKIERLFNENDKQPMENMKILDFSHSKKLHQTPNFFGCKNLKRLVLEGCTSLVEIDSSLGQLHYLVEVNLKGCLKLEVLPKKLDMNSLEEFVLSGCVRIKNLPEFGEKMEKLRTLDVKETSIVKLPESLGFLSGIETLDLKGCKNLLRLPHSFHKLKCLRDLNISNCSSFCELPENLDENEALEKLDASGTAIEGVPSSIVHLQNLTTLAFQGCKKPASNTRILVNSISTPESLIELDLSYCNLVDEIIPSDLSGFPSLRMLDLSGNEFVNLPNGCISNLWNLQYFYLNSCPRLQVLPQPSRGLSIMDAGDCRSLRTLSDKMLLNFFASIEQDGQHAEALRGIIPFSLTIPGSEIPSWFTNQNHLSLNEKHVASVTIDIPEDEWLGIGLCAVIDDHICCPRWGFDFKASDGKYVSLPGRTREYEREIISSHLWIVFWNIGEENRDELLRNYSQIRLKFCVDWENQPPSEVVDDKSIKCGWRFISRSDLERLKDRGNTWCSEAEENSHIIIDRSKALSQVASSAFLEERNTLEVSQMQPIPHYACHHDFSASTSKSPSSNHNSSETCSASSCCPFDE